MSAPLSWNRIPKVASDKVSSLAHRIKKLPSELPCPFLAYGNGRSYGDVCLSEEGTLLLTRGLSRFIQFCPATGVLKCEAGTTLAEVLQLVVPQGWFLPSTPGTRLATVGGAVANDVHGKNHHAEGSFGHHIKSLELLRSDKGSIICSMSENSDYFKATIGGLGLTGLIQWVELQLMPIRNPWMWVQSQRFKNLDEFWALNHSAEQSWPYTVSWIDCMATGASKGRGILLAGQHAASQNELPKFEEKAKKIPFDPPFSLVNKASLKAFNTLYYNQPVNPEGKLTHYIPYFYPLDAISNWNRIYGRKGFFQYQCVIPPESSKDATNALLETIAKRKDGSFLAVLKTFGDKPSLGMMSFSRPGITLALDFPNRGERTLKLLNDLDSIVSEAGGALYPAKDARMPSHLFKSGFPNWELFSRYIDPSFSSRFWKRVTS